MRDAICDCLAVEEANVIDGGSSDGEALLAVPNNVPLVWTQAEVGELWEDGGKDNSQVSQMFHCTKTMRTAAMTHIHHPELN